MATDAEVQLFQMIESLQKQVVSLQKNRALRDEAIELRVRVARLEAHVKHMEALPPDPKCGLCR